MVSCKSLHGVSWRGLSRRHWGCWRRPACRQMLMHVSCLGRVGDVMDATGSCGCDAGRGFIAVQRLPDSEDDEAWRELRCLQWLLEDRLHAGLLFMFDHAWYACTLSMDFYCHILPPRLVLWYWVQIPINRNVGWDTMHLKVFSDCRNSLYRTTFCFWNFELADIDFQAGAGGSYTGCPTISKARGKNRKNWCSDILATMDFWALVASSVFVPSLPGIPASRWGGGSGDESEGLLQDSPVQSIHQVRQQLYRDLGYSLDTLHILSTSLYPPGRLARTAGGPRVVFKSLAKNVEKSAGYPRTNHRGELLPNHHLGNMLYFFQAVWADLL